MMHIVQAVMCGCLLFLNGACVVFWWPNIDFHHSVWIFTAFFRWRMGSKNPQFDIDDLFFFFLNFRA